MIGPENVTREKRVEIAYSIANQVLERYGSKVQAIGLYGLVARKKMDHFQI